MNLRRELDRLAVLLAIKSDDEDENALALLLVALLESYWQDEDADAFKMAFLSALRASYLKKLEQLWIDEAGSLGERLPDSVYSYKDMEQIVEQELSYQSGFLTRFIQALENEELSDKQARARAKSYALSLGKLSQQIYLSIKGEQYLMWVLGDSEHCRDCLRLAGQVRKASGWARLGLYPRCPENECMQNCKCHWRVV